VHGRRKQSDEGNESLVFITHISLVKVPIVTQLEFVSFGIVITTQLVLVADRVRIKIPTSMRWWTAIK